MLWLMNLPIAVRLFAVGVLGVLLGGLTNWAIYNLAWHRRAISPWAAGPPQGPPRRRLDRVPIFGWWGLRREAAIHGRGFWIRPLLIEIGMGVGLAWLYWWEVQQRGLYIPQLLAWGARPEVAGSVVIPLTQLHACFAAHVLLITLMTAASFIDIDEKLIPPEITELGMLAGLILVTCLPWCLLPQVTAELPAASPPTVSLPLVSDDGQPLALRDDRVLVAHPTFATGPRRWSDWLQAAPHRAALATALACYWFWFVAICPWVWRPRRGVRFAIRIGLARIAREVRRPFLAGLLILGSLAIAGVWWFGTESWAALCSGLISVVASGAIVWAVRIVGSFALRREAMGFGDVTLMMLLGAILGWQACLVLFFIAPFAALVIGVLQWIFKSDDVIPYGPFLCVGGLFVIVEWGTIWAWLGPVFEIPGLVPVTLLVCVPAMYLLLAVMQVIKHLVFGIQ